MGKIVAVVTTYPDRVWGGAPVFYEDDIPKAEQRAFLLEKILDSTAHDLKNGTYILVDHD